MAMATESDPNITRNIIARTLEIPRRFHAATPLIPVVRAAVEIVNFLSRIAVNLNLG